VQALDSQGYSIVTTPPNNQLNDNVTMTFIYKNDITTGQPLWYLESMSEVLPTGDTFIINIIKTAAVFTFDGFLKNTVMTQPTSLEVPIPINPFLSTKQVFNVIIYLPFSNGVSPPSYLPFSNGVSPPSNSPVHVGDITIPGAKTASASTDNPNISAVISIYSSS
jgi:hypothetical protein